MWHSLFFIVSLLLISNQALAVIGVCGSRHIPRDKERQVRNIRLQCAARASHYIRTPAAWAPDRWEKWRDLELRGTLEARKKMQAIGQELPLIEWKGSIVYATTEKWEWTDWVYGADPVCGYDTVVHTRTVTVNGKSETETYTTQEMRSCWHDQDRSESRFCSNETMTYDAKFERPTLSAWSPDTNGYFDILPNKYDLLPGEVEDVQIFNSSSDSTQLSPGVEIGDAWNEYTTNTNIQGYGNAAPCRFQTKYHFNVNVVTKVRKQKRGPNAFRMPTDQFGRESDPLEWNTAAGTDGKITRSMPRLIKLDDASDTVVSALSRHSRDFNDEAEASRVESGQGQSTPKETHKNIIAQSPFWKDTQVRVVLYKVRKMNRDIRVTQRMYTRGADVNFNGAYEIPLFGGSPDKEMFRASGPIIPGFWKQFFVGLEPGSNYQFLVAMYNAGVPFYAQDCNHPNYKSHWNCRLGIRGEDNWFSKPLNLDFFAEKNMADERPAIQKFADFQRKPLWKKIYDLFN